MSAGSPSSTEPSTSGPDGQALLRSLGISFFFNFKGQNIQFFTFMIVSLKIFIQKNETRVTRSTLDVAAVLHAFNVLWSRTDYLQLKQCIFSTNFCMSLWALIIEYLTGVHNAWIEMCLNFLRSFSVVMAFPYSNVCVFLKMQFLAFSINSSTQSLLNSLGQTASTQV
jgi:hypothetical protein